jgi:hypothetical protein
MDESGITGTQIVTRNSPENGRSAWNALHDSTP